jgi:hypothetical protein
MGAFMEAFNKDLAESGELVDTGGLTAPVHARRLRFQEGVPVCARSLSPARAGTLTAAVSRTEAESLLRHLAP